MLCQEARSILGSSNISHAQRQAAWAHLLACPDCRAYMEKHQVEGEPTPIDQSTDDCMEAEMLLTHFVEAELAGENVVEKFPNIWQHLQECEAGCRFEYELLRALIEAEPEPLPPPATPITERLPFLQPSALAAPWSVQRLVSQTRQKLSLFVNVSAHSLGQALRPLRPTLAQTRSMPPKPALPLQDQQLFLETLPEYGNLLIVGALSMRSAADDTCQLKLTLASQLQPELVEGIRVVLSIPTLAPLAATTPASGEIYFDNLPLKAVQGAARAEDGGGLSLELILPLLPED